MKFLTLKQRVEHLYKTEGIALSTSVLHRIYRKHGISFRMARVQSKKIIADHVAIKVERYDFAIRMASLLIQKQPIVYLDETTIQVQQKESRTFMQKDHRIILPVNSK